MLNHVYFIRHAPTKANLSGEMLKNYDSFDIEPFDEKLWWDRVGKNIKAKNILSIWVSPTKRCKSTSRKLFPGSHSLLMVNPKLKELDCSSLGDKKFWEISKEEFDGICHPDMASFKKQIYDLILEIKTLKDIEMLNNEDHAIICITHGLFIRYLYNYLTGKGDNDLYGLINSKNFKFCNLDMLECNFCGDMLEVENVISFS